MSYLRHPPPVNMLRVTARPEHAQQRRPDWGYGEQCDEAKLPPNLAKAGIKAVRVVDKGASWAQHKHCAVQI